jgi:peptidoglycan/LPS O-acetylase OafA/YrhL
MSESDFTSPRLRARNPFIPASLLNFFRVNDSAPIARQAKKPAIAASSLSRGRRGTISSYRADIDGLRAVAVLGVILLHAGFESLRGGFLGVDVFFVISGFLVHQQVATRLEAKTFSLFAFYGRRIRRTFPALYLVAAICLIAGAIWLMPGDFNALSRSVIAAGLGVSNIFFATQTGYFDHSAITKPLLHTWSLGVEEQFYLVAPLIPFAIRHLSKEARCAVLFALFALDLVFCIIVQHIIPDITFFMMPPRLWEFLLGSLVAEGAFPTLRRQWMAELAGALALAVLVASMLLISGEAAHPGLVTLAPCLATALLIHLGGTSPSRANRLLGLTPLAFCGLISYSLYLWHWPIIVYAHYCDLTLTPTVYAIGAVLLFALSFLSWKWVETPFRDPASFFKQQSAPILLCSLCGLTAGSVFVIQDRGVPSRFTPEVAAVTSYYDYANRRDFREGTCFITTKYGSARAFDRDLCLHLSTREPNYLLIGDSHGAHLWAGFSQVFAKINLLQATASGCKPMLDTTGLRYCVDIINAALKDFVPHAKLDGIVFAAAWKLEDFDRLKATIAYAKRFVPKVILLGDIPAHESDLPSLLGVSLIEHRPEPVTDNLTLYPWLIDAQFRSAFDATTFVSLVDILCPEHHCIVYAGKDIPLQFDTSHLTTEGSILVAKKLATLPQFAPLVAGTSLAAK